MKVLVLICGLPLLLAPAGCAVGPGTPLIDALKTGPGKGSTSVSRPKGYGPTVYAGESSGLINPTERKATEEYLESLAGQ
ncbi:hypothetical protein DCO57_01755 [Labrenzia sp. 011]|nr:hypothetical protein DCO57_01755 [Labrenzia sp. 011]